MKLLPAIFFFAAALSINAQTMINPFQALHPILKDPNKRNAPTSLDQDKADSEDLQRPAQNRPARPVAVAPAQTVKPVVIVAKIDAGLTTSKISILGTVKGLKGRIFVTNTSSQVLRPTAQFAVLDQRGAQIGTASMDGMALASGDTEKIEVLATNADAADLKLMKLAAK